MARQQLMEDIGGFLRTHDLDVNGYTLAIAHDYLTGADPRIVRLIDRELHANRPITLEWLEQINGAEDETDNAEVLAVLMAKLDASLEEFDKTTRAARTATSDYNDALEHHVDELNHVTTPDTVMSELADIARAMLDRTRQIEKDMSRSELQTRSLKRSLDQARRSAERDHLTGLPNRRAFDGLFASEIEVAKSLHEPLCVAFCDVDSFKRINDTHGHAAGDRVLKVVAQNLARISNDKCHVARHGGEEFVILFRGKTLPEAWEILDEARSDMAERRLVNRSTDSPFGKITFSGGIADVFVHPDAHAALKAADEALYRAKAQGRNCIVAAPRPNSPAING